jgi:hypothetical protein
MRYCLLALLRLPPRISPEPRSERRPRQWVAAHKLVRVAPNPDLAPLDGIDSDGRQRGLTADYLKLIAARTGLEFRVVRIAARDQAARALREHRVDIVPGVVANVDDHSVLYTSSYLCLPAAIYTRAGELGFATLAQLGGHAVAAVEPWPAIVSGKVALDQGANRSGYGDGDAPAARARCRRLPLAYVHGADAIARLKLDKDVFVRADRCRSRIHSPFAARRSCALYSMASTASVPKKTRACASAGSRAQRCRQPRRLWDRSQGAAAFYSRRS